MKTIRKAKHITQEKLSELCDTDTSYIGQIETRKRFPSLTFIEKIASALEVEPYLLFKNDQTESPERKKRIENIKVEFFQAIDGNLEEFLKKILS